MRGLVPGSGLKDKPGPGNRHSAGKDDRIVGARGAGSEYRFPGEGCPHSRPGWGAFALSGPLFQETIKTKQTRATAFTNRRAAT